MHRVSRQRHFPGLSCLLPSRLSRTTRDILDAGDALKALSRLRRDFTQVEVGAMLGTATEVVASWEKGRRTLRGTAGMLVRIVEGILGDWTTQPLRPNDWRAKVWGFSLPEIITRRLGEAAQAEQTADDTFEDEFVRCDSEEMQRTIQRTKNLLNWMEEVADKKREEERNRSDSIVAMESVNSDDTIGEERKACLADMN